MPPPLFLFYQWIFFFNTFHLCCKAHLLLLPRRDILQDACMCADVPQGSGNEKALWHICACTRHPGPLCMCGVPHACTKTCNRKFRNISCLCAYAKKNSHVHNKSTGHAWTRRPGEPCGCICACKKMTASEGGGACPERLLYVVLLFIHILFHTAPSCCLSPCDLLKNEKVI